MKIFSNQLLVLVAASLAVGGVELARRSSSPAGPATAPSNVRRTAGRAGQKETPVADVKLELLKAEPAGLGASTRNPFQFKAKAPPPAPRAQAAVPVPVAIAPPVPQGPPPPPPIALKYIGVLDTAQGRVAVFRDSGGDIVNGKEGDIIDGRYRLVKIGVESADLAYLDGRGRQTIRLSGQ
jgi:hypothetical protein